MQIERHTIVSSKCSCGERARAAHRRARHWTMALFINTKSFLYKGYNVQSLFVPSFFFRLSLSIADNLSG